MKAGRLTFIEACFLIAVLCFSLTPLLRLENEWDGCSPLGAYVYNSPSFKVVFGDLTTGASKPSIYVHDTQFLDVFFIELSDKASYVDGQAIYPTYNVSLKVVGGELVATYEGASPLLTKRLRVEDDAVWVTISLSEPANLTLSFWRWYLDTVSNATKYTLPVTKLPRSEKLSFSFSCEERTYVGELCFSEAPLKVEAVVDDEGIYQVVAYFNVSSLSIKAHLLEVKGPPPIKRLLLGSALTYPLFAALLAIIYVGVRIYGPSVKVRVVGKRH